jgi:hypothetical protein
MPIDPSISLGVQSPNPTNYLSSFIDLSQKKLNLDKSRQTFDADVSQRLAESARANTEANVSAQTAQPRIDIANSQAGQAWANMSSAQLENARAHAASMIQQLQPMANDPNLTTQKVSDSVIDSMRAQNAPPNAIALALQGMPPADAPPAVVQGFVKQALIRAQGVTAHLATITPTPAAVATEAGTQFVNTNPNAPPPVAAPMGAPLPPPNVLGSKDIYGNPVVTQPSTGRATPVVGSAGATMSLPPGESPENLAAMQAQRAAATAAVANVGTEHNLNQAIYGLASNTTTGKMGQFGARVASILGHPMNEEGDHTSDFNTLGKYLARSTAANAQAMSLPNTNAGVALSAEASGTTDYDPATLRRITILNEGMAQGKTLYQQGLENAIKNGGANPIDSARQFTAQWGSTFDPTAMALMAAHKAGNKQMQTDILKSVGGLGSEGAKKLQATVNTLYQLAGQQ